ncbi:Gfo/Idh/MocA family oxidoreductase [Phycisphaera mikurensis]|uniref:Gfo/Idh/MocA-like oxidoreductase N-terminal domain-containing protein n=1 Tax=Phycisphaera mikurensis (strain NBRC 102666 / KCTC 22515 / FYK2301M01) TaxID=1142394 RepID=I0IAI7_PHYMF|nr:Gfo/Idh/MocA family oxidoreductase [Phycisphaera mikurensis]MBB6441728.1 putative dehydrogenase [Phycisphaera mikurensis]BAM02275.1 hypothetical protein PSMK_01160 [Phycisphaera mikurensis NBRC 102666]
MPEAAGPEGAPLGLCFAGLHGFARDVTDLALAEPRVRVVSAGDPAADDPAGAGRIELLRAAGVDVHACFKAALAVPGVEAAWLPVPISLHRPFGEAALAAGKALLCEKPLAGCVEDAAALVHAAAASGLPAAVGFHDLFDPAVLGFKREAHGPGGIGELESVTVLASWPRDDAYFGRNGWAGRLRHADAWVRDSPANNALAHYLMLGLFFAGDDDLVAATPVAAAGRLLRAAAIESFDTVSARFALGPGCVRPGVRLDLHLTHAAEETLQPQVLLRGRRGRRLWKLEPGDPDFAPADRVAVSCGGAAVRARVLPRFVDLCRGVPRPDAPYATLGAGLAHAHAIEALHAAAEVEDLPAGCVVDRPTAGGVQRVVPGLLQALRKAAAAGRLLDPETLGQAG